MKADFKKPKDIKIRDTIMGRPIIEIKGLVNGKPTYASSFIVKGDKNMKQMQGVLVFDYKAFMVSDGLEYWKVICPQLLFRLFYKKRKRDRICGRWWFIGNWIIWFKKEKYYSETSISKEKLHYTRKEIK